MVMPGNYILKLSIFSVAIILLLLFFALSSKKKVYTKYLGLLGVGYSVIYIIWRTFYTLPDEFSFGLIFGIILLGVEIIAFLQSIIFKMFFSSQRKVNFKPDSKFKTEPTVDVIISTYNEPEDVLRRTIVSAKMINHPKDKINIYLGDDGRRKNIEKLANEYGIHYITREDNSHAKAGNINNVLRYATGEFILVLDADMIPKDEIITKMISYFEDSKTGFVQSPQVFYNLDPFQYNLDLGDKIPNEQDFFMRTIEEKRALYNAVLHVGTNAIFRRSALDDIGGIPTTSITEDMATGMLLQDKGYKSFFVKDTLAVGLSVENTEDLIKQRDRWLRGNIQVIKKNNPLRMKGLNFVQKLIYIDGFLYWTFGIQKMVYIISPLLFLLFRVVLFQTHFFDIALMFLPYFLSTSLYFKRVSNNIRNQTWGHIYDTVLAPHMAVSFLVECLTGKELKFNVTPKGTVNKKDTFKLKLAFVHIILLILSITAVITNAHILLNNGFDVFYYSIIINLFWCIYNGLGIFISIFLFLDKSRTGEDGRIPTDIKAKALIQSCKHNKNCDHCGHVTDISESGAKVKLKKHCPYFNFKENTNISLRIEDIGVVHGITIRSEEIQDAYEMGIKFNEIDFDKFSKINKYRFDLKNKYIRNYGIDPKNDSLFKIIFKLLKRPYKYAKSKKK